MNDNQNEVNKAQYDAIKIQVYQMQYDKLREEMMHYINLTYQIPTFSLGAASILIPALLSQTKAVDPCFLSAGLYGLTIFFSAMALHYISVSYNLNQISDYISKHIEPHVNRIIFDNEDDCVFHWETYVRRRRRNLIQTIFENLGPFTSLLLLFLPSAVSMLSVEYLLTIPSNLNISAEIEGLVSLLRIVAWSCICISLLFLLASTIYSYKIGVAKRSSDRNGTDKSHFRNNRVNLRLRRGPRLMAKGATGAPATYGLRRFPVDATSQRTISPSPHPSRLPSSTTAAPDP